MANKNPSIVENYFVQGKNKRKNRRLVVVAIVAVLFFGLIGYAAKKLLLDSDTFKISRVNVLGNKMVAKQDVLSLMQTVIDARHKFLSEIMGTNNMLIWPSEVTPEELALLPAALTISVSKNYGAKEITVTVKEREPYGIWCEPQQTQSYADPTQSNADTSQNNDSTSSNSQTLNISTSSASTDTTIDQRSTDVPRLSASIPRDSAFDCRWFDSEGVMFQKSIAAEGNLIRRVDDYSRRSLTPGSRVLGSAFMPSLLSIFHALEVSGVSIKEVRFNDAALEELEVDTYDGPALFFSMRFPADRTASIVTTLRAGNNFSRLHYVDFRVEGRVYYK
jgi:hypothetical protein